MNTKETYCLKWGQFYENIGQSFKSLREDSEFCDVTLASDDDGQIEVHKTVLAASSPFFKNLLIKQKHPHPLLYMRGIKKSRLDSIVEFLYNGEVNIAQDDLNDFLSLAEELKLKGLTKDLDEEMKMFESVELGFVQTRPDENMQFSERSVEAFHDDFDSMSNVLKPSDEIQVAEYEDSSNYEQFENSFLKDEMMELIGNDWTCKKCGKISKRKSDLKKHMETHMEDMSYNCQTCGKTYRSKNSLNNHMSIVHRNN